MALLTLALGIGASSAIAIRRALGAERERVVWWVVRSGVRPVAAGVGLGLLAALALGRLVAGLLYDVSSADPLTLTAAAVLLIAAALLASWLPTRRASRITPVSALRAE